MILYVRRATNPVIDTQDKNAVMLMSLLLGWFGSDQDYDDEA